jgi:hypothetical protein
MMLQSERYKYWKTLIKRDNGWQGVPSTKDWYNGETFPDLKKELLRILDLCKDFDNQFDEKFLPVINELNTIPFIVTDKSCTGHNENTGGYLSIYIDDIKLWGPISQQMKCWIDDLTIQIAVPYPKITFRWEYDQFNEVSRQLLEILPNINREK